MLPIPRSGSQHITPRTQPKYLSAPSIPETHSINPLSSRSLNSRCLAVHQSPQRMAGEFATSQQIFTRSLAPVGHSKPAQ
ncbi:MAG UNVERIFIED_CONTAM: hypothetical protein LVR18_16480 [Planctomycetaceae bacterium]